MKKILAAITVAATLISSGASAFDAEHVKQLIETGNCAGCDFIRGNLSRANMKGADLSGASLKGANLRASDMTEVNLNDSDLSGADLTDADLTFSIMNGAILCNTTMPNGEVIYSGC
jgi:uncharacterized protein YjbI with pentapeptide repeats